MIPFKSGPKRPLKKRKNSPSDFSTKKTKNRKTDQLPSTNANQLNGISNVQPTNSTVPSGSQTPDTQQNSNTRRDPDNLKMKKTKPIEAQISAQILLTYIKTSRINLKEVKITSINDREGNKRVRVNCADLECKAKLVQLLKDKIVKFHTFTEESEKNKVVVLKGFDLDLSAEEILQELIESEIPAQKVTTIVKSSDKKQAVHLVHLQQGQTTISFLNRLHQSVSGLKVRWENQDPNKKRHTQCHNCQMWGHSSSNCSRPPQCVKCGAQHNTIDCIKPRDEKPTCANCKGEHPANFQGCQSAQNYKKMIEKKRKVQRLPTAFTSKLYDWSQPTKKNYTSQFPSIKSDANYNESSNQPQQINTSTSIFSPASVDSAQELSNIPVSFSLNSAVPSDLFKNFSQARKDFSNLPNISQTMTQFIAMVSELKSASMSERLMIMLKYTDLNDHVA